MKISIAAVLALIGGSIQLSDPVSGDNPVIRISDQPANHTFPETSTLGIDATKNFTILAGGAPPPVPPRPAPKPPKGELNLPLYASASDAVWEKAECKGGNFVKAMHISDREAGQLFSPPRDTASNEWENLGWEDAAKWGWDIPDSEEDEILHEGDFKRWGMDRTFRELGLSDKCRDEGGLIECVTFLHGWEGYNPDGTQDIKDSHYDVDGKTYRLTGAHYGFGFDLQQGAIIAMDRASPASAGKERTPPVEGNGLPALSASSDLAWLFWREFKPGNSVRDLKYFLSLSITNEETQSIMSRAIRNAVPGAQGFPNYPGYELNTDTEEGHAILGTPNAQAFSYFLLQHKATLGNLYISKVHVFSDDRKRGGLISLLMVVEPSPGLQPPVIQPTISIPSFFQNLSHHQTAAGRVDTAVAGPADLRPALTTIPPKPSEDQGKAFLNLYPDSWNTEWDKAQCKGLNFLDAMRGSDSEAGKIFDPPRDTAAGLYDSTHLDDLETWGWRMQGPTGDSMRTWGIDHVLRDMDASDEVDEEGGFIKLVSIVHGLPKVEGDEWIPVDMQGYEVDKKVYRLTGAHYKFAVEETDGIIIAMDRLSPQEAGKLRKPVVEGADELPLIRAFSDIAWIMWTGLAETLETDPKNLHFFMSLSITNEQTQRVISRAIREVLPGAWNIPDWPGYEIHTSTPQGHAILGTPNVQAFSYLLLQHKRELGNMYISKIRVFRDSGGFNMANLLMVVEPVPTEGEEPQGATPTPEAQSRGNATSTNHRLRRWWSWAKL